jgi:hypothetical protein
MGDTNAPPIAGALLVSGDAVTIQQLSESMARLDMFPEVCSDVAAALVLLNQRKFEAIVVDLQLGGQVNAVLGTVRRSPSNRTAVMFTISDGDAQTAIALKSESNFVLQRPLSPTSIGRSLKVAYGFILRERRRYFRCPVKIPVTICRANLPEIHGETVNISENGIAIDTSIALAPGVEVQVHFALPGQESRFLVGATVCWCKKNYLGMQFTAISARLASELQEWLLYRLEESLPKLLANKFRPENDGH